MSQYCNPAELLGLGRDGQWVGFLCAAGAEASVVAGKASDYDAFLSLAAAMPLYEGHPLVDEVNHRLCAETGIMAPLCPHTARAHWDAWVGRHWYRAARDGVPSLPQRCPHCSAGTPAWLGRAEIAVLSEPCTLAEPADDLAAWSERLRSSIPTDGRQPLVELPPSYRFARPDPYHAGLAVRAMAEHRGSEAERHLLDTQAFRVLGGALREMGRRLVVCGGRAEEVLALIRYLADVRCLPRLVWLCDDPKAVADVSGVDARVETGLRIPAGADEATVRRMLDVYATVAPIGRAWMLDNRFSNDESR